MRGDTISEQLVDVIAEAGVRHIYGIVGDSLNPVVDAVRRKDGMQWRHVHHEESAAFAAGAEAMLTGELAVCAGSSGPGNTHLIQGLYDAHRNGAPVLAIASHIPATEIGTGYFQETHPESLFRGCSHYCELVTRAEQMPRVLRIAIQHALVRKGVAVIVLPGDVAREAAVRPTGESVLGVRPPRFVPRPEEIEELANELNSAGKVTIFAGAGVRDAHDEVIELAEKLKAPVGHALGGKEWIQWDNPYDVGMSGMLGYGACLAAMEKCDTLLMLGTDFPYEGFLPDVRKIQVDIDATRIGRRTGVAFGVHGDVGETLRAALPLVKEKPDRRFLNSMLKDHVAALEGSVSAYASNVDKHIPIHPEYVAAQLDELASDDAVFSVDTGMCNVWAARYITPNGRRRVIGSWRHGSMANALPQAIGAQVAYPDRQVISMSGDGGLAMLLGELLTVKLHELPVKVVLFNNASLGMVKIEMLVDGLPDHGTDHPSVNFAAIAEAAGIPATRVTDPTDVRSALETLLATPGPGLLDVVTDANALSIPPRITKEHVTGFALAASKIMLGGGTGRMVEMARSNLRNSPLR